MQGGDGAIAQPLIQQTRDFGSVELDSATERLGAGAAVRQKQMRGLPNLTQARTGATRPHRSPISRGGRRARAVVASDTKEPRRCGTTYLEEQPHARQHRVVLRVGAVDVVIVVDAEVEPDARLPGRIDEQPGAEEVLALAGRGAGELLGVR